MPTEMRRHRDFIWAVLTLFAIFDGVAAFLLT
jgi:hypothetical protein